MKPQPQSRREFLKTSAATGVTALAGSNLALGKDQKRRPKYILGSCMYGYTKLAEIVPEVNKVGASAIDIWPKVHGDQREQLDEMGEEKFATLLKSQGVTLGCITQYKVGRFVIQT